ncbi:hypothetical protein ACOSP7_007523 [Xanthoceras sorbifolium]
MMEPEDLTLQDRNGNTAFCIAARYTCLYCLEKKDMTMFLYNLSRSLLTPEDRADVFFRSIKNDLYGIALKFLKEHPGLVLAHDMDGDTALHVLARKSLYMSGFNKELIATYVDDEKNTLLHLAAKYPDQPSVGGLPAAAPNFQRELIIFKEVEKLMQPSLREAKNAQGLTPKELFAKESTQVYSKVERSG